MDNNSNTESRLSSFLQNPSRALWRLAIPIMFGMGIHTLYNVIDMIFIGRLGGDAIAGIAFNMPIFFLMLGLTMGLGSGVTASIARFIGDEDKASADNSAEHALAMAACIAVVFTIAGTTAPKGKRMGHAGAVISGKMGLASEKIKALKAAGAHHADDPSKIGETLKTII